MVFSQDFIGLVIAQRYSLHSELLIVIARKKCVFRRLEQLYSLLCGAELCDGFFDGPSPRRCKVPECLWMVHASEFLNGIITVDFVRID